MTTYRIAAAAADTFMTADDQGGLIALAAVKGKAIDKARSALRQGADAGTLMATATGAVRKTLALALGAEGVARMGQRVAHADYRHAIATVAGAANHAFSMYLEPGKGPTRADWLRLGAELAAVSVQRTAKGNPSPAAKMADRGLSIHRQVQATADDLRAVADAARKASSVNPEEMAQRAIAQG